MGVSVSSFRNPKPCKTYGTLAVAGCTTSFARLYATCDEARSGEPVQGVVDTGTFCPSMSLSPSNWLITLGSNDFQPLMNLGGARDMVIGPLIIDDVEYPAAVLYFTCPGVYTLSFRIRFQPGAQPTCATVTGLLVMSTGELTAVDNESFVSRVFYSTNNVATLCDASFQVTQTFLFAPARIGSTYYDTGAVFIQAQFGTGQGSDPSPDLLSFSLTREGPLRAVPVTYLPPAPTDCYPMERAEDDGPRRPNLLRASKVLPGKATISLADITRT